MISEDYMQNNIHMKMRKLYNILFLATLFIALQCSKETVVESPLQINTSEFSNISQTMAEGVGYISYNDGCQVTEAGFCWSRNSNPTVTDITVMSEETPERGIFKATISGLDPSSLYYVRAYAKAGEDVYYGNIVRLQTKDVPTDGWCVIDSTPNVSVTSASAVMQIPSMEAMVFFVDTADIAGATAAVKTSLSKVTIMVGTPWYLFFIDSRDLGFLTQVMAWKEESDPL